MNATNAMNKRAAALLLDAKLEHVHGLSAKLDALPIATETRDAIHHFIQTLIQHLETERIRLDNEWNLPKTKLPFKTFANSWIENLERLVFDIESGVTAPNVRALSKRHIGALRNVTEKSVIAEQLLFAPDFNETVHRAINTSSAISKLGSEGDEEIIFTFLDKLFSKDSRVSEQYKQIAFHQIISGAIEGDSNGKHIALVQKLINDERFVPRNEHCSSDLIKTAIMFNQLNHLPFLLHHPKLRLSRVFQQNILATVHRVPQIVRDAFHIAGRRSRRQRKSLT